MYPAIQEAFSKAESQARERPVSERIQSTKLYVERKQKLVDLARDATARAREALNSPLAGQEKEECLVAGGRRVEELLMEEKVTPSPFHVGPPANVDAELEQLREVVRLRRREGIRFPVLPTLEANQELESWMNLRAVDLRIAIKDNSGSAKIAINHAPVRRATPTPRFGGRSPFEGEVPSCGARRGN